MSLPDSDFAAEPTRHPHQAPLHLFIPDFMAKRLNSSIFVVGDNIDTDQIIPAHFLTLVPTIPDEYEKLGSYAMVGLPDELYPTRFIPENEMKTPYRVIIGGKNFGSGK